MAVRAFGVFEGGGVRGYAHIGALKACEDRGIELVGVAGTSIGAIVACLVAVGYKSDELFEIFDDGRETGIFAGDLVAEFFDEREHRRLNAFRKAREGTEGAFAWARDRAKRFTAWMPPMDENGRLWRALASAASSYETATLIAPIAYIGGLWFAMPHRPLLRSLWRSSGALDSSIFTGWLNDKLCEKLGLEMGRTATFRDCAKPLSFVATDLSHQRLREFSMRTDPDLSIAEAAMASATYPFVFRPKRIGEDLFVDGGPVSNFPAWTLDDARSSEHTIIPTFGFRIVDDPEQEPAAWRPSDRAPFTQVAKRLVNTAMWGRGDLESRRIDDLHPMEVRTRVKATDFHRIREVRGELYRSGRARVEDYFRSRFGPRDPREMENRLRSLKALAKAMLNGRGTVRAYVLQRVDDRQARVVYSALYDGDADDALAFRLDSACQTMCLALREPLLIRTSLIGDDQRRAPATKSVHALRPESVTHIYCIPMFRVRDEWAKVDPMLRPVPDEALCFDFTDLRDGLLLDPEIEDVFAAMGAALVDLWLDRGEHQLPERSSITDQPPSSDWTAIGRNEGFFVSSRKLRLAPAIDFQSQVDRATL